MSTSFTKYDDAADAARVIIDSRNIAWAEDNAFTFTSGRKSPVYVNMRGVLGEVVPRTLLIGHITKFFRSHPELASVDVIAGGETAGIPYAAILAVQLEKEFAYVRKAQKGFGLDRLIEGADVREKRVLLVEDLTTDGQSKLSFTDTIRRANGRVENIFSAFYYGFRNVTEKLFAPRDLSLAFLCEWADVLAHPASERIFSPQQRQQLQDFLTISST